MDGDRLRELRPAQPAEAANRIPGVYVSPTSTEGHFTAIRQPVTASPVFLFTEDGVPTRSSGFFNHNALYEVNSPHADGMEVIKGPGTALYGSDAVGGVVDVQTRRPSLEPEFEGRWRGTPWATLGSGPPPPTPTLWTTRADSCAAGSDSSTLPRRRWSRRSGSSWGLLGPGVVGIGFVHLIYDEPGRKDFWNRIKRVRRIVRPQPVPGEDLAAPAPS